MDWQMGGGGLSYIIPTCVPFGFEELQNCSLFRHVVSDKA